VKSNHKPITIGLVYDSSGSAGPTTYAPRYQAFIATVKWINAHGGVDGHQINLITQDDGQTEPGNLSASQSLVQNDGALMLVDISGEQTGSIWASQQGIPVLQNPQSSVVSQYGYIWTPNGGDNPDPTLWTDNVAVFLKRHGFKSLGALSISVNATAIQLGQDYVNSAPRAGLKKGYLNTTLGIGTTNWTPYILGLQNSGTDAVVPTDTLPDVLSLMAALKQQAPNIHVIGEQLYAYSLLTSPVTNALMQGTYVFTATNVAPTNPPVKAMDAILRNYGDAINANPPSENEGQGYTMGLLLKQMLKGGGVNPTRSAIQKSMNHLTDWNSGGIYGKINFTLEHTSKAPTLLGNCLYFYVARGTQFVPVPKGNNQICGKTLRLSF
jgi:branched-chain amino acid transport system substrate-binding protein